MNNKQLYEIRLEDYSAPRYASAVKSYYGTKNDINNLICHLRNDDSIRARYSETIVAFETYDGTNLPVHNVAGQIVPILTSVQELSRLETRLTAPVWNFTECTGGIYPCRAEAVTVCQNLIRTDNGYERCLKAQVLNLEICFQRFGWCQPHDVIWGFPGIVTWDNDYHSLNLYVSQQHYGFDELEQATADVGDIHCINLGVLIADLLGEG